jgi:hypothetical protein
MSSWLFGTSAAPDTRTSIFEFTVKDISGNDLDLSTLRGKSAYLIV